MHQFVKKNHSTEIMSLRIGREVAEQLKEEAGDEYITLNVLANHIFRNYIEWVRDAKKEGFVLITKNVLVALVEKLDDKEIEEIARTVGKNAVKAQTIYMEKKYDLDAFLRWLEIWCKASGFGKKHLISSDIHTYIIQHNMGIKWSLYFMMQIRSILEELLQKKVDFDITPSTVTFNVTMDESNRSIDLIVKQY